MAVVILIGGSVNVEWFLERGDAEVVLGQEEMMTGFREGEDGEVGLIGVAVLDKPRGPLI